MRWTLFFQQLDTMYINTLNTTTEYFIHCIMCGSTKYIAFYRKATTNRIHVEAVIHWLYAVVY